MPEPVRNRPKVKLDSLEALFNLSKEQDSQNEPSPYIQVPQDAMLFPINNLVPFKDHPFRLYSGERLDDMVESIKSNGILIPVIIRPKDGGTYEILSGHNRCSAAKLAGLTEVPVVIKRDITDEEAWIYVIETNLMQRSFSDMLHSEKAAVLAIQHSKMFSQGKRNDILAELNALQNPHDSKEKSTSSQIAKKLTSIGKVGDDYGLSKDTVARYLRVNQLCPELKTQLDDGKINFISGVTLSFLKDGEQSSVAKCIELNEFKVDIKKSELLRSYSDNGKLDEDNVYLILNGELGRKPRTKEPPFKLGYKVFAKYFSSSQKKSEVEEIIDTALSQYFKQLNRERESQQRQLSPKLDCSEEAEAEMEM